MRKTGENWSVLRLRAPKGVGSNGKRNEDFSRSGAAAQRKSLRRYAVAGEISLQ
jgi:hypothetical protein